MNDKKTFALVTDQLVFYVEISSLKKIKIANVKKFQGTQDEPMNGAPSHQSDSFQQMENRYNRIAAAIQKTSNVPVEIITPLTQSCKEARALNSQINSLYSVLGSKPAQVFNFNKTDLIKQAYDSFINCNPAPEVQPHITDAENVGNKYLFYFYLKMVEEERPFTIICDKDSLNHVNLNEKDALYKLFTKKTPEQRLEYIANLTEEEKMDGLENPQPVTLDDFEYPVRAEYHISPPLLAHMLIFNDANRLQLVNRKGMATVNFKQITVENDPQLESTTEVMIETGEWEFAYGVMRAPVLIVSKKPKKVLVAVDEYTGQIIYKYKDNEDSDWMSVQL